MLVVVICLENTVKFD